MAKSKLQYGTVELAGDEFDRKYSKERISMMVEEELVNLYRVEANRRGIGYQTLMREMLWDAVKKKFGMASQNRVEQFFSQMQQVGLLRESKSGDLMLDEALVRLKSTPVKALAKRAGRSKSTR